MTFRVDKHVPIPPRQGRRSADQWTQWPFWQMEVGDSFFVDATSSKAQGVTQAYGEFKRAHPDTDFTQRWRDDDEIEHRPGVRCWRTA